MYKTFLRMFKFKNRKNDIIRDSGQKLFSGKGLFSYLLLMDYKISFYEMVKMKKKGKLLDYRLTDTVLLTDQKLILNS